jgi:hypothetical protein
MSCGYAHIPTTGLENAVDLLGLIRGILRGADVPAAGLSKRNQPFGFQRISIPLVCKNAKFGGAIAIAIQSVGYIDAVNCSHVSGGCESKRRISTPDFHKYELRSNLFDNPAAIARGCPRSRVALSGIGGGQEAMRTALDRLPYISI